MNNLWNKCIAILLLISFSGCTLVTPEAIRMIGKVSDEELEDAVEKIIVEYWDNIEGFIEIPPDGTRSVGDIDARMIVENAMKEEQGRDYMEFCYSVATGADVDTVLYQAKGLLSEENYAVLIDQVDENRSMIHAQYGTRVFDVNDENQIDFYNDLERLVVTTTVLLTAAIIYSFMPHAFFWGKITALAAISVSAGAVAATIMSIYSWYQTDQDPFLAFKDWLGMVTEEPYAAYLMVCSVLTLGQSMKFSPISTGAIIGIFAIYNALSIMKEMIEAYAEDGFRPDDEEDK